MSTDYRTLKKIRFADLFDGRLDRYGVREYKNESSNERFRCLTDGFNYMWVRADEKGDLEGILGVIMGVFATDVVSEYEPQRLGYATTQDEDRIYDDLGLEFDDARKNVALRKPRPVLRLVKSDVDKAASRESCAEQRERAEDDQRRCAYETDDDIPF